MVWLVRHLKATWPPNANLTQLEHEIDPRDPTVRTLCAATVCCQIIAGQRLNRAMVNTY